uniref:Uncharacterized protein n=1 Tax=Meloidogyne enterolobii TaxID=390850 RepID=A0A6V7Y0T2_MELEN|nr:unnamed protein product [Meloidogyne enterolobii]
MSDSSIVSDEDAHEEVPAVSQSNQQQHSDDSSSMSSTSSSDAEHDEQNLDENSTHPQSDQQQYQEDGEDDETSEVNHENQIDAEDSIPDNRNAEEEDDEDGIFTTKDDDEVSGVHATAEHNDEEMEEDEVEHHEEEETQEDVHSHQDEDETHQVIARMDVSDDEEQEEEVDTGPTKIDLNMARCKVDLGEEGPYFVKLPNFLSIETKPFDPETYDDEIEEDETLDDDGRTRLKLKLENTIRWRTVRDEQGNEKRESNAKIVRWSDGSMSLYLGNEIFEVDKQKIMDFKSSLYSSRSSSASTSRFRRKTCIPPTLNRNFNSSENDHEHGRKNKQGSKSSNACKCWDNPNAQRKEMIRLEEEKLRAAARREAQQRKVRERPMTVGLTSGFLEGYDSGLY